MDHKFHANHAIHNEDGSFLIEGALTLVSFCLIFAAFFQLGMLVLREQHMQNETERAVWYTITQTPDMEPHALVEVEDGSYAMQAHSKPHGSNHHRHQSMSLTVGGMMQ